MNYIRYTDSPKTDDVVGFLMETYDDNGLLKNPYVFEQVTIFHIERSGAKRNERFIEMQELPPSLEGVQAELMRCGQPMKLKSTNRTYYSEAKMILSTIKPLWTEGGKNLLSRQEEGKFLFLWIPKGLREGTYMVRWDWRNSENGKLNSVERLFTLQPANEKISSIYRNFVPREKYNFLFDKYIPPMYRIQTTPHDITPEVLVRFNRSIAQMLLELDDLAVGLVDLLSPTYIPDGFLPAFANFFNIQLRSNNTTAWRNQIKHALPLFKKKGTIEGLSEALDKAGIRLLDLTNLWQVVSPYTWTDGFVIEKDDAGIVGHLSRRPIEDADLEVSIKSAETEEYFPLPSTVVSLQEILVPEPTIAVMWNAANAQNLRVFKGDVIKVSYNYKKIPEDAKTVENYIRSLPLADQRNEAKVKYPMKNWNVKLIEETDPMFDLLITERHPFYNPVTYGKIRTTFLYSEKAFNMDAYNGSLYNSNNPCDMDKDFMDQCSGGQSSKFNVHLEFDNVSDERIEEAKEIIIDYAPFHAVLHSMKVSSRINDFIVPPVEKIKSEVKKLPQAGDKVQYKDEVYCQIKYKDGRVINGRLV